MRLQDLIRLTDWLWMVIGGFFLIAYLFWYLPALAALPNSIRDPPAPFPWHWSLDFVATGLSGSLLVYLGFRRAAELAGSRSNEASESLSHPSDG